MLRPVAGFLVLTILSGCSSTFFFIPETPVSLEPGPADYHTLIANDLQTLKDRASMGPFEVAQLRQTRLAQPGDWFACVRTTLQEKPMYFAVFMRDGQVVERRQAVMIDECSSEHFRPLQERAKP
jgi:hypothetical protein